MFYSVVSTQIQYLSLKYQVTFILSGVYDVPNRPTDIGRGVELVSHFSKLFSLQNRLIEFTVFATKKNFQVKSQTKIKTFRPLFHTDAPVFWEFSCQLGSHSHPFSLLFHSNFFFFRVTPG